MSYEVIARKYRPQSFKEISGQRYVLEYLSNALDNNQLHHAYIFTGSRGVGKTSLARLLAKAINCVSGISSKPCNRCLNCSSITKNNFIDLIEIDAASKTKVEDTREILENIKYMPSQGAFKVYLIDEVHMLSSHSFNALLKTLEEPPKHVKFMLATTEYEKIPTTITSRCLQLHLSLLTFEEITGCMVNILKKEKIHYGVKNLNIIAKNAKGSIRDALTLMDQAIIFCNGDLQKYSISDMLGVIDTNTIDNIILYIIQANSEKIIACSTRLTKLGKKPELIIDSIAEAFYTAILYNTTGIIHNFSICSKKIVISLCAHFSNKTLQLYYRLIIKSKRDLIISPNIECGTTMALLRLSNFQSEFLSIEIKKVRA
jgi:DNA polymerase-3 subunit gamma/tau